MAQTIEDIILGKHDIGTALYLIKKRCSELSIYDCVDQLTTIESEYQLMCECFKKGMRDPNGDKIYMSLLKRTYKLYNAVRLISMTKHRKNLSICKNIAKNIDVQGNSIRMLLEGFVQESTMMSLQYGHNKTVEKGTIYIAHQNHMEQLFRSILVSDQWSDDMANMYSRLIVSPTIEPADALLIVSAITLALMLINDVNKWLTLVRVFEKADTEDLRQRALVGIALTLPTKESLIFHEAKEAMDKLFESDDVRKQLIELQEQLLYCERAEEDSRKFQNEILPTFTNKKNNWNPYSSDDIDNILDTDHVDDCVENMEGKMKDVKCMLDQGADIYFGGFSKMKKFTFFDNVSNWFAPFDVKHPSVAAALRHNNEANIVNMLRCSPFCDSDKYSFVFAFASTFGKLPNSMKEKIKEGWPMASKLEHNDNDESRAFIRRKYIQDIYRFFCLYAGKEDFNSPFDTIGTHEGIPCKKSFFVANGMLVQKYHGEFVNLVTFLYDQCQYDLLQLVVRLRCNANVASTNELLLLARSYMKKGLYEESKSLFHTIYSDTNDITSLKGVAYSLFMLRHYSEAAKIYANLTCQMANDKKSIMYHALSLMNSGHIEEGMAMVFKLNYEDQSNMDVRRALAWGHLMRSCPKQAEKIYSTLIDEGSNVIADILNCAYSKWILSKTEEAISLFCEYKKRCMANNGTHFLRDDLDADSKMLEINGIRNYEKILIVNLVEKH